MSTTDETAERTILDTDLDPGLENVLDHDPSDDASDDPSADLAHELSSDLDRDLSDLADAGAHEVAPERAVIEPVPDESAAAWLPVVDSLERALESATRARETDPIVDGVRAVRDQTVSLLRNLGFQRHDQVRVPFDPYLHEAVGVAADADAEPGTVVLVVRPGYGEGDRQLRPAGVVVAGQRR